MITAQGIGSGLDVASIVSQLVAAEGQPTLIRLSTREADVQARLSALGNLKSALSDFRDALKPVKDVEVFRSRKTTTSDDTVFTASANTKAVPASYDIEVLNLAQSHKLTSGAFTSPDAIVGNGTLTFQLGPDPQNQFSVEIRPEADPDPDADPDDPPPEPEFTTLSAIRDAINGAEDNKGVAATIIEAEDGAHLVITSTKTGLDNEITITQSGGDGGLSVLEFGDAVVNPLMSELQEPLDATIRIDSFTRTSSSNTIANAIEGVSIDLRSSNAGSTATLSVAYDKDAASTKVREFVEAYNTLVEAFAGLASYDPETQTASTLLGDAMLREISTALRTEIGGGSVQGYGFYRTLSTVGITTETDGKLTIDETVLSNSLGTDFDAVADLFADEDDGFATRLDAVLEPFLETGGRIESRTDTLDAEIELIADQREALDLRLASVEARYLRQFSALDSIISELTSTSDFLAGQLALLPTGNL